MPWRATDGHGNVRMMHVSRHTVFTALLSLTAPLQAQSPPDTVPGERVVSAAVVATPCTATTLRGDLGARDALYVPRDLDDALSTLRRLLPAESLAALAAGEESDVARHHHGLGTWLRNCWGLWTGSRLAAAFNQLGITHPDDMSAIVLRSLYRQLRNQPIDLPAQLARYPGR